MNKESIFHSKSNIRMKVLPCTSYRSLGEYFSLLDPEMKKIGQSANTYSSSSPPVIMIINISNQYHQCQHYLPASSPPISIILQYHHQQLPSSSPITQLNTYITMRCWWILLLLCFTLNQYTSLTFVKEYHHGYEPYERTQGCEDTAFQRQYHVPCAETGSLCLPVRGSYHHVWQ